MVALSTNINEGDKAEFNIFANSNLTSNLAASLAIHQSGDFLSQEAPTQVLIHSLSNQSRVILSTQDDQIAEANGTITLLLIPHSNYKVSPQNSATITVSDAEDRQHREQEIATRTREISP